jgi:hypothetical protein
MRVAMAVTLVFLSACASEKLALAPPPGVDLSGRWRLNEADSDDPLRLVENQADPSKASAGSNGQGGQGGQGGRGRGRGGGGFGGGNGASGPAMPGLGAMGEGLRWPGKEVEIKQVAGVVAITSAGVNRVYQPVSGDMKHHHRKPSDADGSEGRAVPARGRGDGPPALCGWEDKTLVVQGGEPDDDHPPFEERYSLSDDGQRLIEVVGFKGGRSGGFTLSRVWDRFVPGALPPGAPPSGVAPSGVVPGGPPIGSTGSQPRG